MWFHEDESSVELQLTCREIDGLTLEELKKCLFALQKERDALLRTCQELRAGNEVLLQNIGEANQAQVQAEMTSMELEQVFSSCKDATWVVRNDNTVVRANDAMLNFLGRDAEQVVGFPCLELLGGLHCTTAGCPIFSTGGVRHGRESDLTRKSADEDLRHYIVSSAPLVTLDGTPGIVVQFKDITDRKAAEAALERANIALDRMAHLDSLTQLPNRRSFDENMSREWRRLAREGKQLAVILCDIDYFKQFNDSYGHQHGDQCLRQVAHALGSHAKRAGDLVCRYGGEEFIFLLPDTCLEGALTVAERARCEVEALSIRHRSSQISSVVTLSLGVAACFPALDVCRETLVKEADVALYEAKNNGRNRVVCA